MNPLQKCVHGLPIFRCPVCWVPSDTAVVACILCALLLMTCHHPKPAEAPVKAPPPAYGHRVV